MSLFVEEGTEIPRSMQNTQDLESVLNRSVENQMLVEALDGEEAKPSELASVELARKAELLVLCEQPQVASSASSKRSAAPGTFCPM